MLMRWSCAAGSLGAFFVLCACSSGTGSAGTGGAGGTGNTATTGGGGSGTTGGASSGGSAGASSGGVAGISAGGSSGSTGGSGGSTPGSGGSGGGTAQCSAPSIASACGKPSSIVRALVLLPSGAAASSGSLVVNLNHYRLGGGATGGYPHASTAKPGVSLSPGGSVEVQLDMCSAGEMWSEENCEFNLWAFVDQNSNGALDPGEPAGRTLVEVKCLADGPPCATLALDCTSGASCAAFTDPGSCKCGGACPASPSKIVTCGP